VVTGMVTDRVSSHAPARKWVTAITFCLTTFALLGIAFQLEAGALQLALIGAAMFVSAGACGPAGAMVANLTPAPIHGSAFPPLTRANTLLVLAPAAILMGVVADKIGLLGAFQLIPLAPLLATVAFAIGRSSYANDLARLKAQRNPVSSE